MTVILIAPRCRHCGKRHSSLIGACQPWLQDLLDEAPELRAAFQRLLKQMRPMVKEFNAWADAQENKR